MAGYPGAKDNWSVGQRGGFTIIYDMFMGGGGFSRAARQHSPKAKVIGAEANPIQRQILQLSDSERSTVLELASKHAFILKMFINKMWDGKGTYSDELPGERERLGEAWFHLVKLPFDLAMRTGVVGWNALAAQVLVSSYGFGANIRMSRNGLNIPPNPQKLFSSKCRPSLPSRVPVQYIESSFEKIQVKGGKNILVLIDPPYVLPEIMKKTHSRLTSCYPGHDPYGKASWDLYWDSVTMALDARVGEIVIAGYYSDKLDYGLRMLASTRGYTVVGIEHGALQAQGRHDHQRKHGKRLAKPGLLKPVDYEWRIMPASIARRQLDLDLFSA